ncbi:MAG: hypothetical protein AAGF92_17075 [Myxococcota bacterium]
MVWPQIRTVLIWLHVMAVLLLSLPGPGRMLRKEVWESEIGQRDLAMWADRLSWLGYETKDQFEEDLWVVAEGYANANRVVTGPFRLYQRLAGVRQGWAMFASPQQYPVELHIDVREDGKWEPLYRPLSDEHDFWALQLRHHRTRKMVGRLARGFRPERYGGFARLLAENVALEYPDARRIRIRLYRYRTLPPEQIRDGMEPEGKYEHTRSFNPRRLR